MGKVGKKRRGWNLKLRASRVVVNSFPRPQFSGLCPATGNFSITMSLPSLSVNSLFPGSSCVHRPRDNFPDANSPSPSVITLFARMEISSILDFIARSLAYIPVGSIGKFNFQERAESESVVRDFNFGAPGFK